MTDTAPAGAVFLGADTHEFVLRNLSISGTLVSSLRDTDRTLDFAKRVRFLPSYFLLLSPSFLFQRLERLF